MAANNGSTSPLFARSDRTMVDGIGRSSRRKRYGLESTVKDSTTSTTSFPIKKIAFRLPPAKGDDAESDAAPGNNPPSGFKTSDQIRAERKKEEEFEALKREARAAGLHACKLAHMGIVPGVIYNDGESTKITTLAGSFGFPMKDAKKKRGLGSMKRMASSIKSARMDSTLNQSSRQHRGDSHELEEVKEEIKEELEEEFSGPLTIETPTATTAPTEIDNTTTASGGSKSSKSSSLNPKRLFKRAPKKKKKAQKGPTKTPAEKALEEANELLTSGAWMCGVCGTPFDTPDNAKRHEKSCLVEWLKHDKLVRQAWRDEGRHKNSASGVPIMFLESKQPLNYPEYLPPRTGGEIPVSSPLVKKYLLVTDEALVSVARRQRHIMHEVIDRDLCALSLKKQKAREDPSSAASDDYTDHDEEVHRDLFVWEREYDAMFELEMSSRDRHYYAMLEQRAHARRFGPNPHLTHHDYYYHRLNRIRKKGTEHFDIDNAPDANEEEGDKKDKFSLKRSIKGRLDHAYKLAKEGPASASDGVGRKRRAREDDAENNEGGKGDLKHDENTLYINVVVKNSVQVVNNELQRIARGWWQTELGKSGERDRPDDKEDVLDFQFEWIRAHTQKKVIQLAGMALASDFTPSKVAVQLSKDLYRLMEPQLRRNGCRIQAVIEYREGQYFVLAVNVLSIDWIILMKWVTEHYKINPTVAFGQKVPAKDESPSSPSSEKKKKKKKSMSNTVKEILAEIKQMFPSRNEAVAYFLFLVYHMHDFVAVLFLRLCYALFLRHAINKFILSAVTDDIFRYVEQKGMEMQLGINRNKDQASFMLAALREIRSGEKKKISEEEEEDEDARPIIGPLMGPAVKDDSNEAKLSAEFSPPDVLEFVGLETDLPVGFLRLRWAMLHSSSSFLKDAFYADIMKYEKIEIGQWSANENEIGLPKPPDGVDEGSFLDATLEYSYLMPKSAFVKANMCYVTLEILHYDNYCLVFKEKTRTPEVPYGNTFVIWTQYSIINTGKNTCRMVCSVEAEFPNGQPMVARQIKSGMRSGCSEKFVSLGETICRYADSFP